MGGSVGFGEGEGEGRFSRRMGVEERQTTYITTRDVVYLTLCRGRGRRTADQNFTWFYDSIIEDLVLFPENSGATRPAIWQDAKKKKKDFNQSKLLCIVHTSLTSPLSKVEYSSEEVHT